MHNSHSLASPSSAHDQSPAIRGLFAPGTRLFQRIRFTAKAAIVSAVFIAPIAMLSVFLWKHTQETVVVAVLEHQGAEALQAVMPVFHSVIDVRNATRAQLGGYDARQDFLDARARTDESIRKLKESLRDSGDPLSLSATANELEAAWESTKSAENGVDAQGRTVFGPVTTKLTDLLAKVGDESGLMLDPQTDSFYMVNAMLVAMPLAAEDVGQVWGWSAYALSKGQLSEAEQKKFFGWATNSRTKLKEARLFFERSIKANPALATRIDLDAIKAAETYVHLASSHVDAVSGNPAKLYADGKAATEKIFSVYGTGLTALDDLLTARAESARREQLVSFGIVAACLLLAFYFFRSFYLATTLGFAQLRKHLSAMTAGDLSTSPAPSGSDEVAELMTSLRDMQGSVRNIVAGVRQSAESIVMASAEIASASNDLSSRTEKSAASLEETASAMEQIGSTVRQTADNVRSAAEFASGNSTAATSSGKAIEEVVQTMEEINSSSKRIADIISVIDGIAFQTNILALNAAVEAARAGEQGRGFAVVAGEVRNLAQRSAQAAREIKSLIGDSVAKVEAGTQAVNGAGHTMQELVNSAKRINDLLAEVSVGAAEQSDGVAQVGQAVSELDQTTQQNAALVEQTAATAASLRDQADQLAREVSRFKLPQDSTFAAAAPAPARPAPAAPAPVQGERRPTPARAVVAPIAKARPALKKTVRPAPIPAAASATPRPDPVGDDWTTF